MAKKKQKIDKSTVKPKEKPREKTVEQPVTASQVNATLEQFADGVTKQVSKLLKEQHDTFQKEINRLDNKSNTVAKQVDKTRDTPATNKPSINPAEIFGKVMEFVNGPFFQKLADRLIPNPPPVPNVQADPEYIEYIKGRAKSMDDLLQAQLAENLESLKLKNLTTRKELESDF